MLGRDDLLQLVEHPFVIPRQVTEKLLERAGGHARGDGDRFDALAWKVRQLTAEVGRKMLPAAVIVKTVRESVDEPGELRDKGL